MCSSNANPSISLLWKGGNHMIPKTYEFKSIFAQEINRFIQYKENNGYDKRTIRTRLIAFDRFCIKNDIKTLTFTKDHATQWLKKGENECYTSHYARINASRQFLTYLSNKGYDIYVVRNIKYKNTDFTPHIYTDDEVSRYFRAVDGFSSQRNKLDSIQYPVLFRILYCCGTRINETLGIRKKDVDLDKGIICLNETKNNKQRYIVLGDDLAILLNEYANKRFYMLNDEDYIFTNMNGGRLSTDTLYKRHRDFLLHAGITYYGNGNGPRIHDWRHHMAVYSFKKLSDSGVDMYVALPVLSAYLGHKTIYATERYIRLTLQLFPYIEEKFHLKIDQIFNERIGGENDEDN